MKRRNFLTTIASSPLLNVVSFDGYSDSDDVELGIKADSKRNSKRIFKYKYSNDTDVKDRSVHIYNSETNWFDDVTELVESMGFTDHCIWDIESTSLVYCGYFTSREYQTLLYQIEPDVTVISVHQFGDHVDVAGESFATSDNALAEIQRIRQWFEGD